MKVPSHTVSINGKQHRFVGRYLSRKLIIEAAFMSKQLRGMTSQQADQYLISWTGGINNLKIPRNLTDKIALSANLMIEVDQRMALKGARTTVHK